VRLGGAVGDLHGVLDLAVEVQPGRRGGVHAAHAPDHHHVPGVGVLAVRVVDGDQVTGPQIGDPPHRPDVGSAARGENPLVVTGKRAGAATCLVKNLDRAQDG